MTDSGSLTKDGFVMPIRIYYADTDAGGIVYHANYLVLAERCRSELLRVFELPLVGSEGENFVVKRAEIDWISPASLDDLIVCTTTVSSVGAAKIVLIHHFELDGRSLCNIEIELVYVSRSLRPIKMGQSIRDKFGELTAR